MTAPKRPLRPELVGEAYRRFVVGDAFRLSGLQVQVRQGRKRKDGSDLVIEWNTPTGWVPVGMDIVFLLADFLYENEHAIFPMSMGYQGGEYFRRALTTAMRAGWSHASTELEAEKRNAAGRQSLFDQQDGAA